MCVSSSKGQSISGSLAWKLFERFGAQIVQMLVSIVIARILEPTEYGSVAMLAIFINLATVFVESGLSSALIQKADAGNADQSAVFFYSMGMAVLLYIVLFFASPFVAAFYGMPQLESLLRVLALVLFPGAFNSLQISILSKRMQFKSQAKCSLLSVTVAGAAGILFALFGYGAWALVIYQLGNKILTSILLHYYLRWRPSLNFSISATFDLFRFGVRILGANLVDTLYHNLESLIIGKKFSAATLAFCDKGKMFPLVLIDNVDGAIQSVMYPSYALRQDDMPGLQKMLLKTISASTYLVYPLMIGLACAAEPLVWLILGEKWMGAVPFLEIYCVISALALLMTASFLFNSPFSILIAALIGEIVGTLLSAMPLQATIGVSLLQQFKACFNNLCMALVMGLFVYALTKAELAYPVMLLAQIVVGICVYAFESIVFKNCNYQFMKGAIFGVIKGRRSN